MRVVLRSAFALVLFATAAMAAHQTLGTVSCMTSNSNPTGCYCSNGCAVVGDSASFNITSPVFPPPKVDASTVGSDTICAKITLPYTSGDANVIALAGWLGVNKFAVTQSEVTVWTAFTQVQCATFQVLAKAAVASTPSASKLYVNLCTSDGCNTANVEGYSVSPAPTAGNNLPSLLPGGCPVSNKQNTGCYCTYGCSVNGDTTGFPWKSPSWPPAAVAASVVGSDTICAKITLPIYKSVAAGKALNAYLGVSGDITRNGQSDYNGGSDGLVITTYTAFTQAECANYIATAQNLTNAYNIPLGVQLCNTEMCNGINSTLPAGAGTSSASPVAFTFAAVIAALMALVL